MAIEALSYHESVRDLLSPIPIIARHHRSVHALTRSGDVVTVGESLSDGPLTVCLSDCSLEGLSHAQNVRFAYRHSDVDARASVGTINLDSARCWTAPSGQRPWSTGMLQRHIEELTAKPLASAFAGTGALGIRLQALRRAFLESASSAERGGLIAAAASLSGLGPGLTPAGADWLTGFCVAVWHLAQGRDGLNPVATRVLAVVGEYGPAGTTTLSRTQLKFAVQGVGSSTLTSLVRSMGLASESPIQHLTRLVSVGHTSGADMALGVIDGAAMVVTWTTGRPMNAWDW